MTAKVPFEELPKDLQEKLISQHGGTSSKPKPKEAQ